MKVYLVVREYNGRLFPVGRPTRNNNEVLYIYKTLKPAEKLAKCYEESNAQVIEFILDTVKNGEPTFANFDHEGVAGAVVKHLNSIGD